MDLQLPRFRFTAFFLLALGLVGANVSGQTADQDQVVVAMSVKILSFIDRAEPLEDGELFTIGVFEDQGLFEELKKFLDQDLYRDRFRGVLLEPQTPDELFDETHALLFSGEGRSGITAAIHRSSGKSMVLMGSFEGFLEMGGMVNFVKRQKRLSFEINLRPAATEGIEFRAKLLRLANRVIEK